MGERKTNPSAKKVVSVNIYTGDITNYESISAARSKAGGNQSLKKINTEVERVGDEVYSLLSKCVNVKGNNTSQEDIIYLGLDKDGLIKNPKKRIKYIALYTLSGYLVAIYKTVEDCSNTIGVNRSSISRTINSKNTSIITGWQVLRVHVNSPILGKISQVSDEEMKRYSHTVLVKGNGTITRYGNVSLLASKIGISKSMLHASLDKAGSEGMSINDSEVAVLEYKAKIGAFGLPNTYIGMNNVIVTFDNTLVGLQGVVHKIAKDTPKDTIEDDDINDSVVIKEFGLSEEDVMNGELRVSMSSGDVYEFNKGASTGDIEDKLNGGFWSINKKEGMDTEEEDTILDKEIVNTEEEGIKEESIVKTDIGEESPKIEDTTVQDNDVQNTKKHPGINRDAESFIVDDFSLLKDKFLREGDLIQIKGDKFIVRHIEDVTRTYPNTLEGNNYGLYLKQLRNKNIGWFTRFTRYMFG